ncbi:MAG: hypothetical protein IPF44_03160 [Betaproteobacteria bacterium]|nr:hypothetical protein [Betaproteobacteria bacterium]
MFDGDEDAAEKNGHERSTPETAMQPVARFPPGRQVASAIANISDDQPVAVSRKESGSG